MEKAKINEIIISYLKDNDAKCISIFGSYARGEEGPSSDIDIIVSFYTKKSLLDLIRLERELSEKLNRKIDLLTEKSISPYLIDSIKEEMVTIYNQ